MMHIARFFIIARIILDSFIIKKDPEAVSGDGRMRILVDEEDGLLQQIGITPEDAVLAYARLMGKASSSVYIVKTREACSVIEAVKHNPLVIPQISPRVVNIAEKMLLMVASVGSLEEGKASPGIVNGSYVDWKKAAVSVCILVFPIPLHAARRAMAAACRCPYGQRAHFSALKPTNQIPPPTTCALYRGCPISFSPWPEDKRKEKAAPKTRRKKRQDPPSTPTPRSPSPPHLGPTLLSPASRPPYRPPLSPPERSGSRPRAPPGPWALSPGVGGDGDLHPLADRRASLLTVQTSARAPWAPPQFAYFAAPCGHWWPFPTLHPSTGHRWTAVRCPLRREHTWGLRPSSRTPLAEAAKGRLSRLR